MLGYIAIANNVTVGANATVNKDYKGEYMVLAGTPAKVVKENASNWVTLNNIFDNDK